MSHYKHLSIEERESLYPRLLRAAAPQYFSPKRELSHYLSMASGNSREYLKGDMVRAKNIFMCFALSSPADGFWIRALPRPCCLRSLCRRSLLPPSTQMLKHF